MWHDLLAEWLWVTQFSNGIIKEKIKLCINMWYDLLAEWL